MSAQQYSLKWNNHQPNFISTCTTLLTNKMLVDVTLAAEGKQIAAHKIVLSACSIYFQTLFIENPSQYPIIILKDVSFADLRTIVDFMYYGEVNVTEQQLPKVLETAKMLKIKGLTEMPETTSLTRSQTAASEYHTPDAESLREQSLSPIPPQSPNASRRKRRRKTSSGSTGMNRLPDVEDGQNDDCGPSMDMAQNEPVTLSSVLQKRRDEDKILLNTQQVQAQAHVNKEPIQMESQIPQGGQWSMMEHTYPRYSNACLGGGMQGDAGNTRQCRVRFIRRQNKVTLIDSQITKQISEPGPVTAPRNLRSLTRNESYPQLKSENQNRQTLDPEELGQMLIRAVSVVRGAVSRQASATVTSSPTAFTAEVTTTTHRASHTPAVRSGPPLSCNYCWNTIDDSGRILRRKTQYHCPECRTNLCIVPCFHEYHEVPEAEDVANIR